MKKTLFILLAILLNSPIFAQIKSSYLGMNLGETSKKEGTAILQNEGFEVFPSTKDSTVIFIKDTIIGDISMKRGIASFIDNKLCYVIFVDSCISPTDCKLIENRYNSLTKQYKVLKNDSASLVVKALKETISDGYELEARSDDRYTVVYALSGDKYMFGIIDSDLFFITIYNIFMETLKQFSDSINMVTAVGGCDFGVSYSEAIAHFNHRFGKTPVDKKQTKVTYLNAYFGGTNFDALSLYFAYNKESKRYEFVSLDAQISYADYYRNLEKARMEYNHIKEKYDSKYTNGKSSSNIDNEILEISTYGTRDDGDSDKLQPILVYLKRGLSVGGDIRYYVIVSYYQDRQTKAYMDDL